MLGVGGVCVSCKVSSIQDSHKGKKKHGGIVALSFLKAMRTEHLLKYVSTSPNDSQLLSDH